MIKSKKDVMEAYNKIFSTHGLCLDDAYYAWIISLLGNVEGKRLLDIACGEGILLREAKRHGAETFGMDISYEALKKAQKNSFNSYLVLGDGERCCFDCQFDYITCLGSLEHYNFPEQGCREITRLLKNDGKALIVLPNQFSMHTILDIWSRGTSQDQGYQIIERAATFGEWKYFLEKNGLKILKTYKVNHMPIFLKNSKIRSIRKFFRDVFFYYLTPFYFAREFAFLCQKKEYV